MDRCGTNQVTVGGYLGALSVFSPGMRFLRCYQFEQMQTFQQGLKNCRAKSLQLNSMNYQKGVF